MPPKLLKRITPERILAWGACAPWTIERLTALFCGRKWATPLEIAACNLISPSARLWVLLRPEIVPERELRLFACWAATRILRQQESACGGRPSSGLWETVAIIRRVANGKAPHAHLQIASRAAFEIALDARRAGMAWDAAYFVANVALQTKDAGKDVRWLMDQREAPDSHTQLRRLRKVIHRVRCRIRRGKTSDTVS